MSAQVLVVGAGPVGLTLAMDLARRGVQVLVAELRHRGEAPPVKCNHISARSMEVFRQLGVASTLRDSGLPPDYPHDVAYRTAFRGQELSRIRIPSRAERLDSTVEGPDTWWPTPEPPHRINQIYIEPILFRHAEGMPNLEILCRTRVVSFTQDETGVTATLEDLDSGAQSEVRSDYLIGCDGGRSMVRKAIGASFTGVDVVARVQSTLIDAPDLLSALPNRPAWATFSVNPRRSGNVYAIDGRRRWLVHNYLRSDEPDFEAVDRDWALRQILGVDPSFRYEVVSKEDWIGRRLVAERFRDRRAFICGDSAHLWVPMAGYGMNAGIADAMNLSWQLAARLQGWGGAGVLDGYEAERQPITEQVSQFAMNHSLALQAKREAIPADIEAPGAQGDAVRARFGQELYDLNVQQYCCAGLNFGYFYADSPLIAYDGVAAPGYGMASFTPSTVPGCRTPHVWLKDGRSLYDALGDGFTLLRTDPKKDVAPLVRAAADRGVPLQVLDLSADEAGALYDRDLVLSRPDRHVAWRGDELPADPLALVDRIRGAGGARTP
ncbi:monooxygenase [Ramlibacter sp. Leaf400]|nr:monooxygenase [Ramlibacter sp. Leaf400]